MCAFVRKILKCRYPKNDFLSSCVSGVSCSGVFPKISVLGPFVLKGPKMVLKGLEPDALFFTLVHVGKSYVKFQTPLKPFWALSF